MHWALKNELFLEKTATGKKPTGFELWATFEQRKATVSSQARTQPRWEWIGMSQSLGRALKIRRNSMPLKPCFRNLDGFNFLRNSKDSTTRCPYNLLEDLMGCRWAIL